MRFAHLTQGETAGMKVLQNKLISPLVLVPLCHGDKHSFGTGACSLRVRYALLQEHENGKPYRLDTGIDQ